eukprot:11225672-Prorocentrum_lima.AAC.1
MHCGPGTPPITAQPTIPTPWSPIQGNNTHQTQETQGTDGPQHAEITITPTQAFHRQRATQETL